MTLPVVLISTYELGRQPFGLAAPAALLRAAGADVSLQDLSLDPLDEGPIRSAGLVAFHLPMHTATRLTQPLIGRVQSLNPRAHLCVYGLYAPLNQEYFRGIGVDTVLGGECELALVELFGQVSGADGTGVRRGVGGGGQQRIPVVSLDHQPLLTPERAGLPSLDRYAQMILPSGERRVVGSTEASRGCRHRCRHCPVVAVYDGRFIPVGRPVVVDDVRRQVAAGAQHITFGDPDFFNGPAHSMRLVREIHAEFPELSYDVTVKVGHLRRHLSLLPELKATGCVLVTSAVESFDPVVLDHFDKHHSPDDIDTVVRACRRVGLALNPTFVAFTPWITLSGYRDFLDRIAELQLVRSVSPVQYGIRLLVTAGSRLLELDDIAALVGEFDQEALCYPWRHPDPAVDELCRHVVAIVARGQADGSSRSEIYAAVRDAARAGHRPGPDPAPQPATIPYLTEPWYC